MIRSRRNYAIVRDHNFYDKCIFPSTRFLCDKDTKYHSKVASFLGLLIWVTAMACSNNLSGETALEQTEVSSQKCQPKSKKSEIAASVNNLSKDSHNDSLRVSKDNRKVPLATYSGPKKLVDSASNKNESNCVLQSDARTRDESFFPGAFFKVDERVHGEKGTSYASESDEGSFSKKYRFPKSELAKIDAMVPQIVDISKSGQKETKLPALKTEKPNVSTSSPSASTRLDLNFVSFDNDKACRHPVHSTKTQRAIVTVSIPVPENEVITVNSCRSDIDGKSIEVHRSHAETDTGMKKTLVQLEEKEYVPPKFQEGEQSFSSSDIKSPKMSKMFQILINLDKTEREKKSNQKKTFSQSDSNTEQKNSIKNRPESENDDVPVKSKPLPTVFRPFPYNANHQNSWWDHKPKYNSCSRDFESRRRHRYSQMESRQPGSSRETSTDRNRNRYQTHVSLNSDRNQNRQNHWSEKSRQLVADFLKGLNESEHRSFTSKCSNPNNPPSRIVRGYPTKPSTQTSRSLPERKRSLNCDGYFDHKRPSVQFRNGNEAPRHSGTTLPVREFQFAETTRRPSVERKQSFDRASVNTRYEWPQRDNDANFFYPVPHQQRGYIHNTLSRGPTGRENCNINRRYPFKAEECSTFLITDGRCRSKSFDQSLIDNSRAVDSLRKKHGSSPHLDTLQKSRTKSNLEVSEKSLSNSAPQSAVTFSSKLKCLQKLDNKSRKILSDIESGSDQSGDNSYPNSFLEMEYGNQSIQIDSKIQNKTNKDSRSNLKTSTVGATYPIKDVNSSDESKEDGVPAGKFATLVGSNHFKKESSCSNDQSSLQNQEQKVKNEESINKPLQPIASTSLTEDLPRTSKESIRESRAKIKYPETKTSQCLEGYKTGDPPNDNNISKTNSDCIKTQVEKDPLEPKRVHIAFENRGMKNQLIDETDDVIDKFSPKVQQNSAATEDPKGVVSRTNDNKCMSNHFEDSHSLNTQTSDYPTMNVVVLDKHDHVMNTIHGNSSIEKFRRPEIVSNVSSDQSRSSKSNDDILMGKYRMICRKFLSGIHAVSVTAETKSNSYDKCSVEEPLHRKHDDLIEAIKSEKSENKHSADKVLSQENYGSGLASTLITEIKNPQKINGAESLKPIDDKNPVTERWFENLGLNVLARSDAGIPGSRGNVKLPCKFVKKSLLIKSRDRDLPKELRTCIQRVVSSVDLEKFELKQVKIEIKEKINKVITNSTPTRHPKSKLVISEPLIPNQSVNHSLTTASMADDDTPPQIVARKYQSSEHQNDVHEAIPCVTPPSCTTKLSDSCFSESSASLNDDQHEDKKEIIEVSSLPSLKIDDSIPTTSPKIEIIMKVEPMKKVTLVRQSEENIAKKSYSSDSRVSLPIKDTELNFSKQDLLIENQNTDDSREVPRDANLSRLSEERTEKLIEDPLVEIEKPTHYSNERHKCTPGAHHDGVVTAELISRSSLLNETPLALATGDSEKLPECDLVDEITYESSVDKLRSNLVDEHPKNLVTEKLTDEPDMELEISRDCNGEEKTVVLMQDDPKGVDLNVPITSTKEFHEDDESLFGGNENSAPISDDAMTTAAATNSELGRGIIRRNDPKLSNKTDDGILEFECLESSCVKSTEEQNPGDSNYDFGNAIYSGNNVEGLPVKLSVDVTVCVVENNCSGESYSASQNTEPQMPVDVFVPVENDTLPPCGISKANVEHCNNDALCQSNVPTENEEKVTTLNNSHLEINLQHPVEPKVNTTLCNDDDSSSRFKSAEVEHANKTSNDLSNASGCAFGNESNRISECGTDSVDESALDEEVENDSVSETENTVLPPLLSTSTIEPLLIDTVDAPISECREKVSVESNKISKLEMSKTPGDIVQPAEKCDGVDDLNSFQTLIKEIQCGTSTDSSKCQPKPIFDTVDEPAESSELVSRVDNQSLEDLIVSDLVDGQLSSCAVANEDSIQPSKPETNYTTKDHDDSSVLEEDSGDIRSQLLESAAHSAENYSSSKLEILAETDSSSQPLVKYDGSGTESAECEIASSNIDSNDLNKHSSLTDSSFVRAECSVVNCLNEALNEVSSTDIENSSTVILPEEYISEVSESIESHKANLGVLPISSNRILEDVNTPGEIGNSETVLPTDHDSSNQFLIEEPGMKEKLNSLATESAMPNSGQSLVPATFPDFVPNCDIVFFSDPESNFADNNDNYFSPLCDYSSEVTIYSSEVEECHTDPNAIIPTECLEKANLLTCATNEENTEKTKMNRIKPESEKKKISKKIKGIQKPLENISLDSGMKSKIKEECCSAAQTVDIKNEVLETDAEQEATVQTAIHENGVLEKSERKDSFTGDGTSDDLLKTQPKGKKVANAGKNSYPDEGNFKTEPASGCKRPRRERRAHISKSFVDHDTPSEDDGLLVPYTPIEPKRMSKKERGLTKSKHSRKVKSNAKSIKKRDDPLSVYDLTDYSDEEDIFGFNSSSYLAKYRKPMPNIRKYLLRSDQRYKANSTEVSASVDQNSGSRNPAIPLVRLEESLNVRTSNFLQSKGYIPVETRHVRDTDEGSNRSTDSTRLKRIENSSTGDLKIILSLTKNEGSNYSSSIRVKESKESTDIVKKGSQTQEKPTTLSKRVGDTVGQTDNKGPPQRLKAKYEKRKYSSCKDDNTAALNNMLSSPEYLPDVGIDVTEKLKNMNSKDFETTLKNELQRIIDKQDIELTSSVETRLTGVAVSHDSYSEELRKKASRTKQKLDSMKTSKHKVTSLKPKPKQKSRALYKIEKSCKETILNRVYLKRVAKRLPDDEALCRKLSQAMTDSSNDESDGEAGINRTQSKVSSKILTCPRTGAGQSHNINSAKSASADQPNSNLTEKKIRRTTRGRKKRSSPSLGSRPEITPNSNNSDDDSSSNLINILNSSSSESLSSSPCLFDAEKQIAKPVISIKMFGENAKQTFDDTSETSSDRKTEQSDVSLQHRGETDVGANCTLEGSGNDRDKDDSSQCSSEKATDKTLIDCQSNKTPELLAVPIQESVAVIADENDRDTVLNKDIDDMTSHETRMDEVDEPELKNCVAVEQNCVSESGREIEWEVTTSEQSIDPAETSLDQSRDTEAPTYGGSEHESESTAADHGGYESSTGLNGRTVGNSDDSGKTKEKDLNDVNPTVISEFGTLENGEIELNANNSGEILHSELENFNRKIVEESNCEERALRNEDELMISNHVKVSDSQHSSMNDEDTTESGVPAILNQSHIDTSNESSEVVPEKVLLEHSSSAIHDTYVDTIEDEGKNVLTTVDHDESKKMKTDGRSYFEKEYGSAQPSNYVSENELENIQPSACSASTTLLSGPELMDDTGPDTNADRGEFSANKKTDLLEDHRRNQTDEILDHRVNFDVSGSSDESRIIDTNINAILDKLELDSDLNRQPFSDHDSNNINATEHPFKVGKTTSQTSPGISNLNTEDCDQRFEEQPKSTEEVSMASTRINAENYVNDLRHNASPSESLANRESVSSSTSLQEKILSNIGDKIAITDYDENAIRSVQTTCVGLDMPFVDGELLQGSNYRQLPENTQSLQSSASGGESTEIDSVAPRGIIPEVDVIATTGQSTQIDSVSPRDSISEIDASTRTKEQSSETGSDALKDVILQIDVTARRKRRRESIDFRAKKKKKAAKIGSKKGEQERVPVSVSAGVSQLSPNCARLSVELPGFNWLEEKIRLSSSDDVNTKRPKKIPKKKPYARIETDGPEVSTKSIISSLSGLNAVAPHTTATSGSCNPQTFSSHETPILTAQNPIMCHQNPSTHAAATTVAISILSPAGVVVVQHGTQSLPETITTSSNYSENPPGKMVNKSTSALPTTSAAPTCNVSPILWDILAATETPRARPQNLNVGSSSSSRYSTSTSTSTTSTSQFLGGGSSASPWIGETSFKSDPPGQPRYVALVKMPQQPPSESRVLCRVPHLQAAVAPTGPSSSQWCRAVPKKSPLTPILVHPPPHPQGNAAPEQYHLQVRNPQTPSKPQQAAYSQQQSSFGHQQPQYQPRVHYPPYSGQQPQYHRQGHYPPPGYHQPGQYPQQGNPSYKVGYPHQTAYPSQQSQYYYQDQMSRALPVTSQLSDVGHQPPYMVHAQLPHNNQNPEYYLNPPNAHGSRPFLNPLQTQAVENDQPQLSAQQTHPGRQVVPSSQSQENVQIVPSKPTRVQTTQSHHESLHQHQLPTAHQYLHPQQEQETHRSRSLQQDTYSRDVPTVQHSSSTATQHLNLKDPQSVQQKNIQRNLAQQSTPAVHNSQQDSASSQISPQPILLQANLHHTTEHLSNNQQLQGLQNKIPPQQPEEVQGALPLSSTHETSRQSSSRSCIYSENTKPKSSFIDSSFSRTSSSIPTGTPSFLHTIDIIEPSSDYNTKNDQKSENLPQQKVSSFQGKYELSDTPICNAEKCDNDNDTQRKENHESRPDNQNSQTVSRFREVTDRYFVQMLQENLQQEPRTNSHMGNLIPKVLQTQPCFQPLKPGQSTSEESIADQPPGTSSHSEPPESRQPSLKSFKFLVDSFFREEGSANTSSANTSSAEPRRQKKFVYCVSNAGQRSAVLDAEVKENSKEMRTPPTHEGQNQAAVSSLPTGVLAGSGCSYDHTATSYYRELEGTSSRNTLQKDRPAATNQLRKMLQLFRDKLGKTMGCQAMGSDNKTDLETTEKSADENKPQSVEEELLRISENLAEAGAKFGKQHPGSQSLEKNEKHCDSSSSLVHADNTRFLIQQRIEQIKERITNTIVSELGKKAAEDFQSSMNRSWPPSGEEVKTKLDTNESTVDESTSKNSIKLLEHDNPSNLDLLIYEKNTDPDQNIKEENSTAEFVKSEALISESVTKNLNKVKSEDANVLRIVRQKDDEEYQWKCAPKEGSANKQASENKILLNKSSKPYMDRISSGGEHREAKNPVALDYKATPRLQYSSESTANSPGLLTIETSNSELSSEEKVSRGTSPTNRVGVPSSRLSVDTSNSSIDGNPMKCTPSSNSKSGNTEPSTTAQVKDFYEYSKKRMASHRLSNHNETKDTDGLAAKNKEMESNQTDTKISDANIHAASSPTNGDDVAVDHTEATTAKLEDGRPASKTVEETKDKNLDKRDVDEKTSLQRKALAPGSGKTNKSAGNKSDRKACGLKSRIRKNSATEIDLLREELERTRKEVEELRMRQDRMLREKMESESQKFDTYEKAETRNPSETNHVPNTLNNSEPSPEKEPILKTGTEESSTYLKEVPPEPDDSKKLTAESDDSIKFSEIQPAEKISMPTQQEVDITISNELTQDKSWNNHQPDAFHFFPQGSSKARDDDHNVDVSSNCHDQPHYANENWNSEQFRSRLRGSLPDEQNNNDQMGQINSSKLTNTVDLKFSKSSQPGPHLKKSRTDFEELRRLNPDLEILRVDEASAAPSTYEGNKDDFYECASITLIDPRPSDSMVPPKKRTKMMWDSGCVGVSSGSSSPVVSAMEGVNKSGTSSMNGNMSLASAYTEASMGKVIDIPRRKTTYSQRDNTTIPIATTTSSFLERKVSDPSKRPDSKYHQFYTPDEKTHPDESSRSMVHNSELRQKPEEHYSRAAEAKKQHQYRQMEANQHSQSVPMNAEEESGRMSFQAVPGMMYQQAFKQSKRRAKTEHFVSTPGDRSGSSQNQPSRPEVKKRTASTSRNDSADYTTKSEQRPSSEPKSFSVPSSSGYPRPTQGPSSDPYSFHSTLRSNEDQRSGDFDGTRSLIHDQRHSSAFNRPSDSSSRQDDVFVQPKSANSSNLSFHHSSTIPKKIDKECSVEVVCVNVQSRKRKASDGDTNFASKEYKQIHNMYSNSSDTIKKNSPVHHRSNENVAQSEYPRIPSGQPIEEKSQPRLPIPSRPSLPFDEQRSYPPLSTKPIVLRHPLPVQPKPLHPLRTNQNPYHSNSPFVLNSLGNVSKLGHSFPGAAFNHLRKSPSVGFSQHESGLPTAAGTSAGSSSDQLNHSYTASSFLPQQGSAATRSLRNNEAESNTQPQTYLNSMTHPHSATLTQLAHEQELSALYHQRIASLRYPVPGYDHQLQQVSEDFTSNKKIAESQQKDWQMPQACYVDQNLQNQHYQRQTQQSENCLNMTNILQNKAKTKMQTYHSSNQQLQNQYMQDLLNKRKQFDSDKAQYEQYRLYQALQQQKNIDIGNRQNTMLSSQSGKQYHDYQTLGFQAPAVSSKSDPSVVANSGNDSQRMPLNLQKHSPDRERNSSFLNPNLNYFSNGSKPSQTAATSNSASCQQSFSKPTQTRISNSSQSIAVSISTSSHQSVSEPTSAQVSNPSQTVAASTSASCRQSSSEPPSTHIGNLSQTVAASTSATYQQNFSKPSQAHPSNTTTYQTARSTHFLQSSNMSVVSPSSIRTSAIPSDSGASSATSVGNKTASGTGTPTNTQSAVDPGSSNRGRNGLWTMPVILCCVCDKTATIRCPQCKKTEYCNEQCRFNHWVTHSKDCLRMGGTAITIHRKNMNVSYY